MQKSLFSFPDLFWHSLSFYIKYFPWISILSENAAGFVKVLYTNIPFFFHVSLFILADIYLFSLHKTLFPLM